MTCFNYDTAGSDVKPRGDKGMSRDRGSVFCEVMRVQSSGVGRRMWTKPLPCGRGPLSHRGCQRGPSGIVAVSAVERVAGGDDEGLNQVAGLSGG